MTKQEIMEKLETIKKGVYTKITFQKDLGNNCVKVTEAVVRLKVNYYNLKSVLGKQKSDRKITDIILMENTLFENKEGKTKLRVFTTNNHRTKSTYYLNGVETDKKELLEKGYIQPKESKPTSMYMLFTDNIIKLGA